MRKPRLEEGPAPEHAEVEPTVPREGLDPGAEVAPVEPGAAAPPAAEPSIDYKDRWLRAEADLQNFRRRSQRDLDEAVRFAEQRVLLEMIAALDDLERALEAAREHEVPEAWVQGVQLVASRMRDTLSGYQVTAVDPAGAPFDPELHEAMLEVEAADVAPGHVVQVIRKGYQRDGRSLRPARVVVARPGKE